jgi:hypothetical protein
VKIIAGGYQSDSGEIWFDGHRVNISSRGLQATSGLKPSINTCLPSAQMIMSPLDRQAP